MYAPSSLDTNRALPQALKQHPQQLRVLQLLLKPRHPLQLRLLQLPQARQKQRPLQLRLLQLPLKRLPLLLKLQRPQPEKLL